MMERMQLSVTAQDWTWRNCHCPPSLCSPVLLARIVLLICLFHVIGGLAWALRTMPMWGCLCLRCKVWNLLSQIHVSQYFWARRDQKVCLAFPFFTLPSLALSNLTVITQTGLCVQMFTHTWKSLWLEVSTRPPLSAFIPAWLLSVYV